MRPPAQRATDLAIALRAETGKLPRITQTVNGGIRISVDKPTGLTLEETHRLIRLLSRADRFGNTSWAVWAEVDTGRSS